MYKGKWTFILAAVAVIVFGFAGFAAAGEVPPLEAGYYQLGSAEDLKWFRDSVNAGSADINAQLTADIDLSAETPWKPIGVLRNEAAGDYEAFSGVFDGQGHKVTGLTIKNPEIGHQGLFGYVRGTEENPAVVKNLSVENAVISGKLEIPDSAFGAVAARSMLALFSNCSASGTIDVEGHGAGGVLGIGNETTVAGSTSSVNVTALNHVGGIAGVFYDGVITDCSASGTIHARTFGGGIAGTFAKFEDDSPTVPALRNNTFSGTITGARNIGGIGGSISGAVDVEDLADSVFVIVENCTVTMPKLEAGGNAGGVAGRIFCTKISDCSLFLDVAALEELGKDEEFPGRFAGGVVGSSVGFSVIDRSFHRGAVSAETGYAGGIAGYSLVADIYNCVSQSDVKTMANGSVGGIVGRNEGGRIANCAASGKISSIGENSGGVGGIVGHNIPFLTTDKELFLCSSVNNTSTADVSGGAAIGGIVGQSDTGTIQNCTALGTVQGDTFVGGIAGVNFVSTHMKDHSQEPLDALIRNCAASVSFADPEATMLGGIVGRNGTQGEGIPFVPEQFTIEGDFYSGEFEIVLNPGAPLPGDEDEPDGGTMKNNSWSTASGAKAFYGEWNSGISEDIVALDSFDDVVTSYTAAPDGSFVINDFTPKTLFRTFPGKNPETVTEGPVLTVSALGLAASVNGDNNVEVMGFLAGKYVVHADLTLSATKFGANDVKALVLGSESDPALGAHVVSNVNAGNGGSSGCGTAGFSLAILAALPLFVRKRRS